MIKISLAAHSRRTSEPLDPMRINRMVEAALRQPITGGATSCFVAAETIQESVPSIEFRPTRR